MICLWIHWFYCMIKSSVKALHGIFDSSLYSQLQNICLVVKVSVSSLNLFWSCIVFLILLSVLAHSFFEMIICQFFVHLFIDLNFFLTRNWQIIVFLWGYHFPSLLSLPMLCIPPFSIHSFICLHICQTEAIPSCIIFLALYCKTSRWHLALSGPRLGCWE